MKNPARSLRLGFAPVVVIIVIAIVGLALIGVASGAIKGSFKITKNQPQSTQNQETAQDKKAAVEPSATPSPKAQALSKTYSNSNLKFQINYPENWTTQETKTGVNIYAPGTDVTSTAKSDAALIVSSSPLGTMKGLQLSTIADVTKTQIGSFLPGATVRDSAATKINGQDAYVFHLDLTQDGQNYPSEFYVLISQENLYGVITSVSESKKPNYAETLKSAINSFKIL